jgi:peptidoglycan/LPS O-acetylase OafA/YrhL
MDTLRTVAPRTGQKTADVAPPRSSHSFRPDIEGLRGVGVLLVIGCHCRIPGCAGGFIGVDIFFVLSGYLITGLLSAEYRATAQIHLLGFYARRARRLLPALTVVLVATTILAATVLTPQEITFTGRAALTAALYSSNLFFDRNASDYFAPHVEANPLLHTWSLGLEEQFYLLWPLLIFLADRSPQRTRSVWILSALIALSFAFCVLATRLAPTVAFYELPARAWEFGAGGLLALISASRPPTQTRWAVACGFVGLTLILAAGMLIRGGAGFPGWIVLVPVAGTLATLFAGAVAPRRGISKVLSAAPLQWVGSRSYAWYLWHWPVIVFAGTLFPGITVGGRVAAALAALLPATLTFSFVERPVRQNHHLSARPAFSLRLAAAVMVLSVGASWMLMLFAEHLALNTAFRTVNAAQTDHPDISNKDCVNMTTLPRVRTCVFGAPGALHTLVLFGDSHALQWFNAFRTAANLEAWRLVTVLRTGCAASEINPHRLPAAADSCIEWRARAIETIAAIHPTAVVVASYTGATLRGYETEAPISVEELRVGTRRTLEGSRIWAARSCCYGTLHSHHSTFPNALPAEPWTRPGPPRPATSTRPRQRMPRPLTPSEPVQTAFQTYTSWI